MTNELSQSKIMQALNWTYDKAVNGVTGFESAEDMANDYLKGSCNGLQSKTHEPAISAISDQNYLQLTGGANRDYLQLNLQSFISTCNHLRQTDIICN